MDLLSSSVRLLTCKELSAEAAVGAPVATLYRQGDSDDTGWGPLGRSAFVLLDGEISVQVLICEHKFCIDPSIVVTIFCIYIAQEHDHFFLTWSLSGVA